VDIVCVQSKGMRPPVCTGCSRFCRKVPNQYKTFATCAGLSNTGAVLRATDGIDGQTHDVWRDVAGPITQSKLQGRLSTRTGCQPRQHRLADRLGRKAATVLITTSSRSSLIRCKACQTARRRTPFGPFWKPSSKRRAMARGNPSKISMCDGRAGVTWLIATLGASAGRSGVP
jgi:hypothetical protein